VNADLERRSSGNGRVLLTGAVRILAVLAVVGVGLLLGRVLASPAWTGAVTVVGLIAVGLTMLLKPAIGLLVWIALAPYSLSFHLYAKVSSSTPALDVTRIAVLLLSLRLLSTAVAPHAVSGGARRRLARLTWTEIAMAASVVALALSAPASHLGAFGALQTIFDFVLTPMLVYYFARNWLRDRRALMAAVGVVAGISVVLSIISIREQLTGYATFSPIPYSWLYEMNLRRVLSVFGSPAAMSTVLAIPLPFLLYGLAQSDTPARRLALGVALLVTLAGVFFVYVRSGWLGALLGIIATIALGPKIRRTLLPAVPVAVLSALGLSMAALVDPSVIQKRIASEGPIEYRVKALQVGSDLFRRSPILGYGFSNYGTAAAEFGWNPERMRIRGEVPSPHNSYLDVLVSGGLLALIPYLAVFATLAWRALSFWRMPAEPDQRRANRDLVAVVWATLLCFMVILGTFDVLSAQYAIMLFFFIVGAVLGRLEDSNGEHLV